MNVVVPEPVRRRALLGGQQTWLDELPEIVGNLGAAWKFEPGEVLDGGSEALVAFVRREDGTEAVLKILIPHAEDVARHEIEVMLAAAGRGCARLLQADVPARAMLLERLGPPLMSFGLAPRDRQAIMAATAQALWQVPAPPTLPSGADKGRWLISFIEEKWESLGRPCSEQAVHFALEAAERRILAHDAARAVLVHGDIHELNTLQAIDGWKLIDPDGIAAEPEYDLGVIMRMEPVGPGGRDSWELAHWLAGRTATDAAAIFDWAAAERLSTALVCTELEAGYEVVGREQLANAEQVALAAGSA